MKNIQAILENDVCYVYAHSKLIGKYNTEVFKLLEFISSPNVDLISFTPVSKLSKPKLLHDLLIGLGFSFIDLKNAYILKINEYLMSVSFHENAFPKPYYVTLYHKSDGDHYELYDNYESFWCCDSDVIVNEIELVKNNQIS